MTVPAAFQRRVSLHGKRVILRRKQTKDQPHWDEWTWEQYHEMVQAAANALIAEGLPRFGKVATTGDTRTCTFITRL